MRVGRKDAVVLTGCVLFLMASLGAIGANGRQKAKSILCLSNLGQASTAVIFVPNIFSDGAGKCAKR